MTVIFVVFGNIFQILSTGLIQAVFPEFAEQVQANASVVSSMPAVMIFNLVLAVIGNYILACIAVWWIEEGQ